MSRLARDFSWHLVAFVMVIAGLSVMAPLAWRNARLAAPSPQPSRHAETTERWHVDDEERLVESVALASLLEEQEPAIEEAMQPQVAPLGPLVADQIDLDPSISETPALPMARGHVNDDPLLMDATGDLRLSATLSRPVQPTLPDLHEASQPLRQPIEPSLLPDTVPPLAQTVWPEPEALILQLRALSESTPQARELAQHGIDELEQMSKVDSLAAPEIAGILTKLQRIADNARALAQSIRDDQVRSPILRAGYAVVRRIVIWDQVHALAASGEVEMAPLVDAAQWQAAVAGVDALFQETGAAANWRKYLLLDRALHEFDNRQFSAADQRQLARDMLHRLHSTQLSREQEHFLTKPSFVMLDQQLHSRAAETPDLSRFLAAVERYEREDQSAAARALAREYDVLRWSCDKRLCELADTVNAYYRNANIRVALSSELVNRMLPKQTAQLEPVEDTILGAWVSGQSHTNTNVRIALIPDEHRWNIGLEAVGQVASDTASSKGPATFYQNGWSLFRARKRLTVDRRGIRLFNAEGEANANNEMNEFETDFDGIPFLGGLVRAIARRQYDSSQPAAKVEVESKIVGRATGQLDREVAQKIEQAKQDFQAKLVKPLRELQLEPTAVDMGTTAERLIARYRVASRESLSAYTPRPQAPSDSMLSVQIHESALNNVLLALNLQGRRVELTELYREMTSRFTLTKAPQIPEDLPENVYVAFAEEDPVRLECESGRVKLTIRLQELAQEGTRNRWSNFTVVAYYEPSADQLDANLRRVGIIELIGEGRPLPIGQRVALSGIFNRVLSKSRKLQIINKQIAESPQLQDQQVTQFVIQDGWIGVALGPKAPGRQAAMTPRGDIERD